MGQVPPASSLVLIPTPFPLCLDVCACCSPYQMSTYQISATSPDLFWDYRSLFDGPSRRTGPPTFVNGYSEPVARGTLMSECYVDIEAVAEALLAEQLP